METDFGEILCQVLAVFVLSLDPDSRCGDGDEVDLCRSCGVGVIGIR